MSFTPEMIYHEVKKHVPNLAIEYSIDDRQKIGKAFFVYLILIQTDRFLFLLYIFFERHNEYHKN